MKTTNSL
jgi:protocatechuate 3,4-dioxygenase beta subunit